MKKIVLYEIIESVEQTEELKEIIILKICEGIKINKLVAFNLKMKNTTFEEKLREEVERVLSGKGFERNDSYISIIKRSANIVRNNFNTTLYADRYKDLKDESKKILDDFISTTNTLMKSTSNKYPYPTFAIRFTTDYSEVSLVVYSAIKKSEVLFSILLNDEVKYFMINAIFSKKKRNLRMPRYHILRECEFEVSGEPIMQDYKKVEEE